MTASPRHARPGPARDGVYSRPGHAERVQRHADLMAAWLGASVFENTPLYPEGGDRCTADLEEWCRTARDELWAFAALLGGSDDVPPADLDDPAGRLAEVRARLEGFDWRMRAPFRLADARAALEAIAEIAGAEL